MTFDLDVDDAYTAITVCAPDGYDGIINQIEAVPSDGDQTGYNQLPRCGGPVQADQYDVHVSLARPGDAYVDGLTAKPVATTYPYTFDISIPDEVYDLIASDTQDNGMAIRRGVSIADENQTILDVDAVGAPLSEVSIDVPSPNVGAWYQNDDLWTAHGGRHAFGDVVLTKDSTLRYTIALAPPSLLVDGDVQLHTFFPAYPYDAFPVVLEIDGSAVAGPQVATIPDLDGVQFGVDDMGALTWAGLPQSVSGLSFVVYNDTCSDPLLYVSPTASWRAAHDSTIPLAALAAGYSSQPDFGEPYVVELDVSSVVSSTPGVSLTTQNGVSHSVVPPVARPCPPIEAMIDTLVGDRARP